MRVITGLLSIVFLLFLTGCDPRYGFLESKFMLSTDSRLPKFILIPNDVKPGNVLVAISIYSNPISGKAKVEVFSQFPEHKKLYNKVGNIRTHPLTEKQFKKENRYDIYPNYMIIKINNIEEIFEQRTKNDILYVVDQPK